MPTFSLLTTLLIQTEDESENDWQLQRKFYLADRYNKFINPLFKKKARTCKVRA